MPDESNQTGCLVVIFGASGDLTKRKLVPALYLLWDQGKLPDNIAIMGVSRTKYSDDDWREELHAFNEGGYDDAKWADFQACIHYHAGDATKKGDWAGIKQRMCELDDQHKTGGNILFYLSVSPQFFEPIINNIGGADIVVEGRKYCSIDGNGAWQRIVVEKPFGSDPDSAAQLNRTLAGVFDEDAIYRIDHYLGKELVQNMLVLRFANAIFEPLWNQRYVDHIQITASETVDVGTRGSYYDSAAGGAMRDMVQSHLLQVLSVVAMEPPVSMDAADIRTEKIKVFKALRVPGAQDVPKIAVRGQYGPGAVKGKPVIGYRDTEGVDPHSQTDTFAAMLFNVDTWRWGGVPFYLRSGKAMAEKKTEIVIYFKPTPHCLFRDKTKTTKPNQIVINVQPDEGIRLRFEGKVPGSGLKMKEVVMDFDYVEQWKTEPPDGYATLLHDAIKGDQTLFKHRDEIQCAWDAVQPVLDYWADNPQDDLPNYSAGTWGPPASDLMMQREGRYWRNG
ncbi:MAG: glucose-6-phosphate dehydrogenase [Phycisphaeraceae bacterium]